ncbi:hypothetical protein HKX48_000342 [Thoreauomyces humboldtii]|nr:hypothetical protein HKX48_000342 [Thoreauomyces humboldtii]
MKFTSIIIALAVAPSVVFSQTVHNVMVASGKQLTYTPANLTVATGDEIKFLWMAGPHTVTQMVDMAQPCTPLVGGVDTGSLNTTGTATMKFNTVGMRTFGCTVGKHCAEGMRFQVSVLDAVTMVAGSATVAGSTTAEPTNGVTLGTNTTSPSATTTARPTSGVGARTSGLLGVAVSAVVGAISLLL